MARPAFALPGLLNEPGPQCRPPLTAAPSPADSPRELQPKQGEGPSASSSLKYSQEVENTSPGDDPLDKGPVAKWLGTASLPPPGARAGWGLCVAGSPSRGWLRCPAAQTRPPAGLGSAGRLRFTSSDVALGQVPTGGTEDRQQPGLTPTAPVPAGELHRVQAQGPLGWLLTVSSPLPPCDQSGDRWLGGHSAVGGSQAPQNTQAKGRRALTQTQVWAAPPQRSPEGRGRARCHSRQDDGTQRVLSMPLNPGFL